MYIQHKYLYPTLNKRVLEEELERVLHRVLGVPTIVGPAVGVFVVAEEHRSFVLDAGEFLDVVDGVIRGNAHDGAHLITFAVESGGPAFAAYAVLLFIDDVVLVAFLLEIHRGRKTGRARADDGNADVFVHIDFSLLWVGSHCRTIKTRWDNFTDMAISARLK